MLASQAAISLENARLYHEATHDPLTSLANRNLLYQTFEKAVKRSLQDDKLMAIIFLDLDYFKKINDSLGHEVGDKLLLYFSEKIKSCIKKYDLAVRLGGDEFVILLDRLEDTTFIKTVVSHIYSIFEKPANIWGHQLSISMSMGVSLCPIDAMDIHNLLKLADIALYRAKENGRNNCQFYTTSLSQAIQDKHIEETDLKEALAKKQFVLYYQPIIGANTNKVTSFEALIRWEHPERGCLAAKEFIPLAEKNGLIIPLGEWAIRAACEQIRRWQNHGLNLIPIAVNISGEQFKKSSVSQLLNSVLEEYDLDTKYLQIEITESIFIEQSEAVLTDIKAIEGMGIQIILDDFGMGYSSLSYLKHFSPSKLKIDQSFLNNIFSNDYDKNLISAIITLAHNLKLEVIVEGVETKMQLDFLQTQLVSSLQGYYVSFPLDEKACTRLLEHDGILTLPEENNLLN